VVCHVTNIRGPRLSFYPSRGSIDSSTFPLVHYKRAFQIDNLLCLFVGEVADVAWRFTRFYTLRRLCSVDPAPCNSVLLTSRGKRVVWEKELVASTQVINTDYA